jgi:hypothetical protein
MSREKDALVVSGVLGIVAGFFLILYRLLLTVPFLQLSQNLPPGAILVISQYIGVSLLVLFYSLFIDELFSRSRIVAVAVLLGQWGMLIFHLVSVATGFAPAAILLFLATVLNIIVAVVFIGAYLRTSLE